MTTLAITGATERPFPFALSLSKGCTFFFPQEEGQCFDKLSTNGDAGKPDRNRRPVP